MAEKRNNYEPSTTPELTSYKDRFNECLLNGVPIFKSVDPAYTPVSEASTVTPRSASLRNRLFHSGRRIATMARYSCSRACAGSVLKENLKLILLLVAILAGGGLGFGLRAADIHKDVRKIMYVSFIGDIFLNMLKVVILPLIVSSLVTGLAAMESQTSGKIGLRAVIYYLTTTFLAVILGIVLVVTIQPGKIKSTVMNSAYETPDAAKDPVMTVDTFLDLIRNMFPSNIVQACFEQYRTVLTPVPLSNGSSIDQTVSNTTVTEIWTTVATVAGTTVAGTVKNVTTYEIPDYSGYKISGKFTEGINVLGIVVFSIVFGITISRAGPKGKPLAAFFESLNEVTMKIVGTIMWIAPIGVAFLVAGQILKVDDFEAMVAQLGMYFMTVMVGLIAHGLIILPLVFVAFTRKNPYPFIGGATKAYATGFATSSSSATLPITIECCEVNNGVDPRISRFVLPIGATINMDGTALYEAVAAIFVAQTQNIPLDLGKIIAVSITATAAAIGAAGVPQAGLVTLVMVLDAVGLPAQFVGSILAVDWFLDRIRTTVNILGDVIGTGIVDHLCKGFLKELDAEAMKAQKNQDFSPADTELQILPVYSRDTKPTGRAPLYEDSETM